MGGTAVQRNDLSKMEKKKSGVIDKARKEKNEPSLNEHPSPRISSSSQDSIPLSLISLPSLVQAGKGNGITRTNSSINSIRQRVLPTLTSAAEGWAWKLRETTLVSVLRGLRRSLCSNYLVCSINSRLYTRYFPPFLPVGGGERGLWTETKTGIRKS